MIERSRRFSTTAHALYALMADDDVVQNIMKKKHFITLKFIRREGINMTDGKQWGKLGLHN